jgi:hypothetical protein
MKNAVVRTQAVIVKQSLYGSSQMTAYSTDKQATINPISHWDVQELNINNGKYFAMLFQALEPEIPWVPVL